MFYCLEISIPSINFVVNRETIKFPCHTAVCFTALGIAVEILFLRHEKKDWNGTHDPLGERPTYFFETHIIKTTEIIFLEVESA